jgi:RimK family alpha-L-glutamate ligase
LIDLMKLVALIETDGWMSQDLQAAAGDLGIGLQIARWSDLSASATPEHLQPLDAGRPADHQAARCSIRAGDVMLSDADAVLLRTMGGGTLEQIVFRMDVLHRLEAMGVAVLNPPRAIEIAVDKYLSSALLNQAGLPTPPTIVCQRPSDAMDAFKSLGEDVVVKPIFGSQGVGITRITDRVLAQRAFKQIHAIGSIIYLQKFIQVADGDLRLFVLGDRVLAAMHRRSVDDFRTNIAQGAKAQAIQPEPQWADLALRAAQACGAKVAGVDILIDRDGRAFVLEVNAVPGWKHLAKVTGVNVTREVLIYAESQAQKASTHA